MEKTKVILAGTGGYGAAYLRDCFYNEERGCDKELVAVIEPFLERSNMKEAILAHGTPVFESLDAFFASGLTAELAILVTPLPTHLAQCEKVLAHGMHLLCEKPIVPTLQDLPALRSAVEAAEKRGQIFGIGFQWNYDPAFVELKKRILAGEFGRALRMKVLISWPRNDMYYSRGWAAKLYDANGNYILDSIVTNATAHYIQIMLFLLGETMNRAAEVTDMKAALYRANPIETYDTAVFTAKAGGTDLYMYTTHAGSSFVEPELVYEFEKAAVTLRTHADNDHLYVHYHDGREEDFGKICGGIDSIPNKVDAMISFIRAGEQPLCGIDASESALRVANGLLDFVPITPFPKEMIRRNDELSRYEVPRLTWDLLNCYDTWTLPGEAGYAWAVQETEFSLSDYDHFEGRLIPPFRKN